MTSEQLCRTYCHQITASSYYDVAARVYFNESTGKESKTRCSCSKNDGKIKLVIVVRWGQRLNQTMTYLIHSLF